MNELTQGPGGRMTVAQGRGSFARGLLVALPLSVIVWLLLFWAM